MAKSKGSIYTPPAQPLRENYASPGQADATGSQAPPVHRGIRDMVNETADTESPAIGIPSKIILGTEATGLDLASPPENTQLPETRTQSRVRDMGSHLAVDHSASREEIVGAMKTKGLGH